MLGGILQRFRYYGGDEAAQLREKLAARKPATFGSELISVYLADQDAAAAIEFIAGKEEALRKQPEEKQRQIAQQARRGWQT